MNHLKNACKFIDEKIDKKIVPGLLAEFRELVIDDYDYWRKNASVD